MKKLMILMALGCMVGMGFTLSINDAKSHFTFGQQIQLKAGEGDKLAVSDLKSKRVNTYYYQDTIITFDPIFLYETWELTKPVKDTEKVIIYKGGKLDLNAIPQNIEDIIMQDENGLEYELANMVIQVIGKRSRGVYLYQIQGNDAAAVAKERQTNYEWMTEGIVRSDKIILSDLLFKNGTVFKKIENKICFEVK